mgnify:CR=1 FL=1
MKDFFKFTLATITGIIVSCVVLFFVSILILFSMLSSSESETQVRKNSVMMLDMRGMLSERSQDNPFDMFLSEDETIYGLDDILSSIQKAKENENIKGIYLQAGSMGAGFASIEEIRKALADFKNSGKFIVAYGDQYSQHLYYLASVADKIMLNPQGSIGWYGLASTPIFYKDLLSKIGVEMQVFKVGTYKSAVEPFIATEMSPANREQVTVFLNSIWNQLLDDVSVSRNISKDSLNAYADQCMDLCQAEEYIKCGLADSVLYKDEMIAYLKQLTGRKEDQSLNSLFLEDMINVKKNVPKDKSGNIVAVYYAYGDIYSGSSRTDNESNIYSDEVIRDLRKLKEDEDVKAVVLRVNSPGGSAFGSEQIWYAVTELKKEKPVIVSMGDYAASGGYYISCNADSIVADPTTLTGSIGIFGMFPNVKGLTDKIGLSFDVVKTNTYSDFGMMGRALNDGEKALMQNMVNEGYELFVKRCAEGRGMTTDEIKKIAEGRVWTGAKAKELGLVDELGGLDKALEMAIGKAGLDAYTVMSYPGKKSFFETLMDTNPGGYIQSRMLKGKVGELYNQFDWLNNFENYDKIQARVPFELNIN